MLLLGGPTAVNIRMYNHLPAVLWGDGSLVIHNKRVRKAGRLRAQVSYLPDQTPLQEEEDL